MEKPGYIVLDLRCAYCGLDHRVQVEIPLRDGIAEIRLVSEGIDVLNCYRTASIIEPL